MSIGILFDLDGTLLNTLEDLRDATNAALRHFGYPERTLEEIRTFVGNGARNQLRLSLPAGAENLEEVLAWYQAYYPAHCQIKTAPYEGIPEALAAIPYPVAIVSNKPDAAVKPLCARYFPGIFALGEAPGCPRKPDPAMVRKAMEAIGVTDCIYVGDSEVDVLTAKNAGVRCLSVLWGFRNRAELTGAEHFCADTGSLAAALEALIYGQ